MQFEFFANNGKHFKTIDPVLNYTLIPWGYLVLEFEFKFEKYHIDDFKKILINGKDLKEYEKEKGKAN